MKRWISLLLSLLLVVGAASGCAETGDVKERFSILYFDTFDTLISLIGYADDQETFNRIAEEAHQTFLKLHRLFDAYNEYEGIANICTLNRTAAQAPVEVDPALMELLVLCKEQQPGLHGTLNIAMGSVLLLWHDYREAGLDDPAAAQLPPMEALQAAAAHTNMDDLVLDTQNMTVFFADPELKLDVGAVAKGFATERVARQLEASDMPSFIISAGGNVRAGAAPADGRAAWGIGIQRPEGAVLSASEDDLIEIVYLSDMSVVTSGDYQRYYTVDGVRYHHLIDPTTLMPATHYRSVSILTHDSGMADLLSTAAFLLPYEESRALVESLEGVEAIWVMPDESVRMTDGAAAVAASQGAGQ